MKWRSAHFRVRRLVYDFHSAQVCGTCYRTKAAVLVPDVAAFQGRVGCDVVSKAEIALPILRHSLEISW